MRLMSAEPFITSLNSTFEAALTSPSNNRYFGDNALPVFIKYWAELSMPDLAVRGEDTHCAPSRANALCHHTLYQHPNLWWCQRFPGGGGLRALHSGWRGRSLGLTHGVNAHLVVFLVFVLLRAELLITWMDSLISLLFPPVTVVFYSM